VRAGWLHDAPNARYANPTSHRAEREGWIASLPRVRAWLHAAGRAAPQLLLGVGDGRGDTEAWGKLDLPHTVCCVRTRQDSHGSDLPNDILSGRGRRRVASDRVWQPQDKGQVERLWWKGWQRWALEVGFRWRQRGFGLGEKPCWGLDGGERGVGGGRGC
jgi:hypothetical protein